MNLYYNQPILLELAHEFNVDDVGVSRIPVLYQAGFVFRPLDRTDTRNALPIGMLAGCCFFRPSEI
jgi:hypothetical protein